MSIQPRDPQGIPTGGQFASRARTEPVLRLVDPWTGRTDDPASSAADWRIPRDPFRPLLAGLTAEEDNEWRDLDALAENGLRPAALTPAQRARYGALCARVSAQARNRGWMPGCPVHGGEVSDYAVPDASTWGAEPGCSACTRPPTGEPRPLADRLTITDRIDPQAAADILARRQAAERVRKLAPVHRLVAEVDTTLRRPEADDLDGLDEHQQEAIEAFREALSRAQRDFEATGNVHGYADALQRLTTREAQAYASAMGHDPADYVDTLTEAVRALRDYEETP